MTERPGTRNSGQREMPRPLKGLSAQARGRDCAGGRCRSPAGRRRPGRRRDSSGRPSPSPPARREAIRLAVAVVPNTMKSLKACALPRSAGRYVVVSRVVAPTNMKFQPTPFSPSAPRKCHSVVPSSAIATPPIKQRDADGHDVEDAEALDQVAGEEGRQEHAHDVHEDGDRRLALAEAALHDGERRGGHHERHHAESDHRARRGHHVGRLRHDLEQRPLRAGRDPRP